MEDVYTIKVKTKPDTRNLYPSERRYSASTVSGLAWVHIALAATSFLLACLALVNPSDGCEAKNSTVIEDSSVNSTNVTSASNYIIVVAPSLLTVFALASGVAAILASVRWYIDRNITWVFVTSILSTIIAFTAFVLVAAWFATAMNGNISEFYKDKIPFTDFLIVKHTDVIVKNETHMIVARNPTPEDVDDSHLFTKRVLSINILIAAFLEFLWSILSVKISYKGMRSNYKDDDNRRRGNCISVVTTIKGNNTKKLPRNAKLIPPRADLIDYPNNKKIKKIFLAQSENGFYLKNQGKPKQGTETSSEFYKERMMNFLNRCASMDGYSNPDPSESPSIHSESVLNPIPEATSVEINKDEKPETVKGRMTPVSWGDSPDHTIYNQDTLNLDNILNYNARNENEGKESDQAKIDASENVE